MSTPSPSRREPARPTAQPIGLTEADLKRYGLKILYGCGGLIFLSLLLLSVSLNVYLLMRSNPAPTPAPGPTPSPNVTPIDNQDRVTPIDDSTSDYSPQGSTLVVVAESKDRPVDQIQALDNHEFWNQYLPGIGVKFFILDPDDPDAASYVSLLAKKNIKPPFICQEQNQRLRWWRTFPVSSSDPTDFSEVRDLLEK